jgi:hypothetical protein
MFDHYESSLHQVKTTIHPPPSPLPPISYTSQHTGKKYQKYYFCKIIFNAFIDAATLNLKEKGIISKREELLNFSCSCKTTCMKRDNSSVYCKEI